eukprot:gene9008-9970_t
MAEITKIEPLDGNNYQSWKYNIKLVLMERGLWGFSQGTEDPPSATESQAVRNAFQLRSDKAYSLIALSVSKALQVHIMSTTDPATAWKTLQEHFEFISVAQVVRLNRKFYAANMKEGENLLEHITYMTSLAEQLKELKEEISSRKFATVLLGSLPDSYENFISGLNARSIEELQWENIKGSLVEEYIKRKDRDEKHPSATDDALYATYGVGRNQRGYNGRGRARNRGIGRSYGSSFENNRDGPRSPRCYKCNELGHIVKNCPLNKKNAIHSNIAEECKSEAQSTIEEMALTSSIKYQLSNGWYVDSGATKHMTFQKDELQDYTAYKESIPIRIGDDSIIEAYGEGKVKLYFFDGEAQVSIMLQKVLFVPKLAKRLLSVIAMTQMGAEITFNKDECVVTKNGRKIRLGQVIDEKLYQVNATESANYSSVADEQTMQLWHCRYGHVNYEYINQLVNKNLVEGLKCTNKGGEKHCTSSETFCFVRINSKIWNLIPKSRRRTLCFLNYKNPLKRLKLQIRIHSQMKVLMIVNQWERRMRTISYDKSITWVQRDYERLHNDIIQIVH